MRGHTSIEEDRLVFLDRLRAAAGAIGQERGDVIDGIVEAVDHGVDLGAQTGRHEGNLAHVLIGGELRQDLADLSIGNRDPLKDVERRLGVLHADHDH